MKCPACSETMTRRQSRGVEIDLCARCGGLWLDASEFDALIGLEQGRSVEASLDLGAKLPDRCRYCEIDVGGRTVCPRCRRPTGLACPRDGRPMYIVDAVGVELDRCNGCGGLWVDGFERCKLGEVRTDLRATAMLVGVQLTGAASDEPSIGAPFDDSEEQVEEQVEEHVEEPSMVHAYMDKHRSLTITCAECDCTLSRYSAWQRGSNFYCQTCAGEEDRSYTLRSYDYDGAQAYWNDERHLLDTLKWVAGTLKRTRGK